MTGLDSFQCIIQPNSLRNDLSEHPYTVYADSNKKIKNSSLLITLLLQKHFVHENRSKINIVTVCAQVPETERQQLLIIMCMHEYCFKGLTIVAVWFGQPL